MFLPFVVFTKWIKQNKKCKGRSERKQKLRNYHCENAISSNTFDKSIFFTKIFHLFEYFTFPFTVVLFCHHPNQKLSILLFDFI